MSDKHEGSHNQHYLLLPSNVGELNCGIWDEYIHFIITDRAALKALSKIVSWSAPKWYA